MGPKNSIKQIGRRLSVIVGPLRKKDDMEKMAQQQLEAEEPSDAIQATSTTESQSFVAIRQLMNSSDDSSMDPSKETREPAADEVIRSSVRKERRLGHSLRPRKSLLLLGNNSTSEHRLEDERDAAPAMRSDSEQEIARKQTIQEILLRRKYARRWLSNANRIATRDRQPLLPKFSQLQSTEDQPVPREINLAETQIALPPTEIELPTDEDEPSKRMIITVVVGEDSTGYGSGSVNRIEQESTETEETPPKSSEVEDMDEMLRLIREEDSSAIHTRNPRQQPKKLEPRTVKQKVLNRRARLRGTATVVDEPAFDGCVADYDEIFNTFFDVTSLVGIDSPLEYAAEDSTAKNGKPGGCQVFGILSPTETFESDSEKKQGSRRARKRDDDEMEYDWNEFFAAF